MRVVIVVESKHGSTRAIAEVVGDEIRKAGLEASIVDADATDIALDGYDAAVIGSAVYVGRWMKNARVFLEANRETLRNMPLWMFSSGPLKEGSERPDDLAEVRAFAADVLARDSRIFAGSLDKADLSLAERAAVKIVHAPYGDSREWGEIRSWAATIAAALTATLIAAATASSTSERS